MIALLWIPDWFWHPLRLGNGYNFWSGFGSDLGEITLVIGVFMLWRKHVCHVKWCPRIQWKASGEHVLCRRHHPSDPPKASDL